MIKFSSRRPRSPWRVWGTTYLVLSMRLLWMVGRESSRGESCDSQLFELWTVGAGSSSVT